MKIIKSMTISIDLYFIMWTCTVCTFGENVDTLEKCEICDTPKSQGMGICTLCTFQNNESTRTCEMCHAPIQNTNHRNVPTQNTNSRNTNRTNTLTQSVNTQINNTTTVTRNIGANTITTTFSSNLPLQYTQVTQDQYNQLASVMRSNFQQDDTVNFLLEQIRNIYPIRRENAIPQVTVPQITVPQVTLQKTKLTKKDKSVGETCAICIEDMKAGRHIYTLGCDHVFHVRCLKKWMKEQNTCPNCRAQLTQ